MTNEEKARAYDVALEQAKKELNTCGSMDCDAARQIFRFFPQLRESEDERIRKFLVDYFASYKIGNVTTKLNGVRIDDILNYLEKQKINTEGDFGRGYDCGYQAGYAVAMNEMKAKVATATLDSEKQKEPHYTKRNALFDKCVENCDPEIMKRVSDDVDEMLQKEQKPAEWSEEDEDMLNSCISSIEEAKENRYAYKETDGDTSYDHEIAWLKLLRPSWKPSEEQLVTLLRAEGIVRVHDTKELAADLARLYEQMKAIKEDKK